MAIKIIDEPDIHLTQAEHEQLLDEYRKQMQGYAGPFQSFETWLRKRRKIADENRRYDF